MQSDLGTENVNVAYAQMALHHSMEPALRGTFSIGGSVSGNIKPEIHWSVFQRTWSPGFQAFFCWTISIPGQHKVQVWSQHITIFVHYV